MKISLKFKRKKKRTSIHYFFFRIFLRFISFSPLKKHLFLFNKRFRSKHEVTDTYILNVFDSPIWHVKSMMYLFGAITSVLWFIAFFAIIIRKKTIYALIEENSCIPFGWTPNIPHDCSLPIIPSASSDYSVSRSWSEEQSRVV